MGTGGPLQPPRVVQGPDGRPMTIMPVGPPTELTAAAAAGDQPQVRVPALKPGATDQQLVRATKIGIGFSWILGYALAFVFDRLMALWVFNASLMTSTVLVPIMMCLFWKGRRTAAAGVCSFLFGMVSVIVYYFGIDEARVAGVH